MGDPFPKNCPFSWGDLDPHLTHNSLGQSKSTVQTASWSVQPFLHRWPQSVPVVYNSPPLFPTQNCPFPWGDLDLHVIHCYLGPHKSSMQTASRSVQLFLQGSLVWQTDRPTDHAIRSVTVDYIYVCSMGDVVWLIWKLTKAKSKTFFSVKISLSQKTTDFMETVNFVAVMFCSFGQGSSLLWTHTLRPFIAGPLR